MRDVLWSAAEERGGVLTRAEAVRLASEHVLDGMASAGLLVRAFPNTYVMSHRRNHRDVVARAAIRYRVDVNARRGTRGPEPALSHLDGLAARSLPCPSLPVSGPGAVPIHVTEGPGAAVSVPGIEVHRRMGFAGMLLGRMGPADTNVVSAAQAVVESWPLLPELDKRAPLLVALRDRHVSAKDLEAVLDQNPRVAGAAAMREMVRLVTAGVHSPLELWGHTHVFSDPRLAGARLQHPVRLRTGRMVYLDRYYEDLLLDVELDGAAYHGLPGQRERDLKRDAALAALGILVVRFGHQRLHQEPAAVIEELVQILAVRRRQLSVA